MKVGTQIKGREVVVLIDSGSSHNFIDQQLVKKIGWPLDDSQIFDIMIGDGSLLKSRLVCLEVPLQINTYTYISNILCLPLCGCDIVLGIQWLKTLGPVLWDFKKLTMEFFRDYQKINIVSAKPQHGELISSHLLEKSLGTTPLYGIIFYNLEGQVSKKETSELTVTK